MNRFEEILRESGGWLEGHTEFKNGYHGNGWVEKGNIIKKPRLLDLVTKFQAEQIADGFSDIDLVIGPVVNGAIVSCFVAKHLDKEFTITLGKKENIEFHRMNVPSPPCRVMLVEDLIFTGTDVSSNIDFIKNAGLDLIGVSVWINRQESKINGVDIISLLEKPPFEFYEKDTCPLCEQNLPIKYKDVRE